MDSQMSMTLVLRSFRRRWTAESSPWALRTKQFVASVLPDRVLVGLKKRYYLSLLRADADELMETDARALPWLLKPGDFVIDVGAFVGFYSQRLSRLVGPAGLVWSFEPMPPTSTTFHSRPASWRYSRFWELSGRWASRLRCTLRPPVRPMIPSGSAAPTRPGRRLTMSLRISSS